MTNPLIQYINAESDIGDGSVGVFVLDQGSPRTTTRGARQYAAIVGVFGWGDAGAVYTPTDPAGALDAYWPFGPDNGTAYAEVTGLNWGPRRYVNVRHSGAVAATVTADSKLKATATKAGASGNNLRFDVIVNATTATSRDVIVYGIVNGNETYRKRYYAIQTSDATVTDPGDPWITFSKASGAIAPAAASTGNALISGTNGSVDAADFTAALELLNADDTIGTIALVGVPDAIVDAVDLAAKVWAATDGAIGKTVVLATEPGIDAADAITAVADIRSQRVRKGWPCVRKFITYSYNGMTLSATQTVSPGTLLACSLQRNDPWVMVALTKMQPFNAAYIGLETAYANTTASALASLAAAGVTPLTLISGVGVVAYNDVTTALGTNGLPIDGARRRYTDFVISDLTTVSLPYLTEPLDVVLSPRSLGPSWGSFRGALVAIMEREREANHIIAGTNDDNTASPAYAVDMFSGNTAPDLANGRGAAIVAFRITPNTKQIVLKVQSGTSINIVEG